jgi:hypothetical protein
LRYWANVSRGGTPAQRFFIISASIATDGGGRILLNILNDPAYVRNHARNWELLLQSNGGVRVNVDPETDQILKIAESSGSGPALIIGSGTTGGTVPGSGIDGSGEIAKSLFGLDIDFSNLSETILNKLASYLGYILKPVAVDFPIELLSSQIHFIGILLFVLTIFLVIFFFSLLFNITIFLLSDRLLAYFQNKYIK